MNRYENGLEQNSATNQKENALALKVISFNIRNTNDKDGNSVAERAPRLKKILSLYDADVIGFQEYVPNWEPFITNDYGEAFELFIRQRAESDPEASPILWRKDKFDCLKKGYFWLSDTPETESRGWDEKYHCYRMCVYVILRDKKTGTVFTFMNTHFGFGDSGQIASAKLLHEYSKKISPCPTVVVGDFNMTPQTKGYAAMTEHFVDVNAATVNDLRTTYHGYHPEKHESHIDYCFVGENIRPISQKIIDDLVDGKYPSDHYGLYVRLEVTGK